MNRGSVPSGFGVQNGAQGFFLWLWWADGPSGFGLKRRQVQKLTVPVTLMKSLELIDEGRGTVSSEPLIAASINIYITAFIPTPFQF